MTNHTIMEKLTKAEEKIMKIIWRISPCTVGDIRKELGDPPPPHSTISTIVRLIDSKGYLTHQTYGRTFLYNPTISKLDYGKSNLTNLISNYFEGSTENLVSFLIKDKKINKDEMNKLFDELKNK